MASRTKAPSTDVVKREDGSVEISGTALQDIAHALVTGGEIKVPFVDPQEASQAIMMRILDGNAEDAFSPLGSTLSGRDLVGVPLQINPPLRAFPSSFEEGPNFFFVFDATRMDSGEDVVVSCGASNVLAALIVGLREGRFPEMPVKFWEPNRTTRRGFKPLWLVRADFQEPEPAEEAELGS